MDPVIKMAFLPNLSLCFKYIPCIAKPKKNNDPNKPIMNELSQYISFAQSSSCVDFLCHYSLGGIFEQGFCRKHPWYHVNLYSLCPQHTCISMQVLTGDKLGCKYKS